MKSMVIYDSYFGNTEQIAQAISSSIGEECVALRVSEIKSGDLTGLNLLIVGSPTRAFRPTKAINDFLAQMPKESLKSIKVAAFDTRISTVDANSRFLNVLVKLFGYAAKPIADKLQKNGGDLVVPPEWFFVKESEGPLKDGELERAKKWAMQIAEN